MEEKFLHYVWKHRLFNQLALKTTAGNEIEILRTGEMNSDSGPDFFNAHIRVNGNTWAGNLEIHVKASEWNEHGHQHDRAYDNVILHVVYENDREVKNSLGMKILTLELKDKIYADSLQQYQRLKHSAASLACGKSIGQIPAPVFESWLTRLAVERLEQKVIEINEILSASGNNLSETFYRYLARHFGFSTNALPFYLLACSLPLKTLQRHADHLFQLEALLLGQAGFLEDVFEEKYPKALQNEYAFLRAKYGLMPLKKSIWKTSGIRPMNFPVLRIAQFAALLPKFQQLLGATMRPVPYAEICGIFRSAVSDYWKQHYSFNRVSASKNAQMGQAASAALLINALVPFAFLHARRYELAANQTSVFMLLEAAAPEDHAVSRIFKTAGFSCRNALHSQALLQLKRNYCEKKKCLDCAVAHVVLKANP